MNMNNSIEINCAFHRPVPFSYGKGHIIKTGFKYDSTSESIQVYLKVLDSRAIMEISQQQEKFVVKVTEMSEIDTLGRIRDVKTDFLSLNLSELFDLIYLFISKPDDCDDGEIQITRDGKTIEASYKDVISCVEDIYQSFTH